MGRPDAARRAAVRLSVLSLRSSPPYGGSWRHETGGRRGSPLAAAPGREARRRKSARRSTPCPRPRREQHADRSSTFAGDHGAYGGAVGPLSPRPAAVVGSTTVNPARRGQARPAVRVVGAGAEHPRSPHDDRWPLARRSKKAIGVPSGLRRPRKNSSSGCYPSGCRGNRPGPAGRTSSRSSTKPQPSVGCAPALPVRPPCRPVSDPAHCLSTCIGGRHRPPGPGVPHHRRGLPRPYRTAARPRGSPPSTGSRSPVSTTWSWCSPAPSWRPPSSASRSRPASSPTSGRASGRSSSATSASERRPAGSKPASRPVRRASSPARSCGGSPTRSRAGPRWRG